MHTHPLRIKSSPTAYLFLLPLLLKRRRRARKVEPQVKVQSAAVDAVTGRGPAPPTAQVWASGSWCFAAYEVDTAS
jgi:hypothetical protein